MFDPFEELAPPAPPPTLAAEGEAHSKLKRNLDKALEVHLQAMSASLPGDITAGDKRLMVESAHATVKAALATDRTALRAKQENTLELVFLRVLFHRWRMGMEVSPTDAQRLVTAPRAKVEAAIGSKMMVEYDKIANAG